MANATEAGADAVASPLGPAQQQQPPMQPDEASTDAASPPAPDITALLRELFKANQTELQLVIGYIRDLENRHHCSRLWEERDSLYQRLATRLYIGCRGAKSRAFLECLTEEIPVDACNGTRNRELFQGLPEQMEGCAKSCKAKVEVWRSVMSAGTSQPLPSATAASTKRAIADTPTSSILRDMMSFNSDHRQMVLGEASRCAEVSRRAEAIIGCLDAQARLPLLAQ